jgi:hypothetical protein
MRENLTGVTPVSPLLHKAVRQQILADRLYPFISIFLTCFVIYFIYSGMFGSYSDDQYWIALHHSGHLSEGIAEDAVWSGRPISDYAISILYLVLGNEGLSLFYLGNCLVLVLETSLVFLFFRLFLSNGPSLILAFVYLLFPADTHKYALNIYTHLSSIMFWISAILYAKRRVVLAAILVSATILIYETHLTQAIFIPLIVFTMRQLSGDSLNRSQELHLAAAYFVTLSVASGLLLGARLSLAPGRLSSSLPGGAKETMERLLSAGWLGIKAVAASHIDRFKVVASTPLFAAFDVYLTVIFVLILDYFLWYAWREPLETLLVSNNTSPLLWPAMLLGTGVILMYVYYLPFALEPQRWPPSAIIRRPSGIHFGASVGYVLIWAGLFRIFCQLRRPGFAVFLLIFLLYFSISGSFFLLYQRQLIENWQLQINYWRQIEECLQQSAPKLVIVDSDDQAEWENQAEQIFDWTTPYVPYLLERGSRSPKQWPLVLRRSSLKNKVELLGDQLKLNGLLTWFIFPTEMQISLTDIMVVKPVGGVLVRPPATIRVGSITLAPHQVCYAAVKPGS